jgi:hypothetical protein
VKSSLIKDKKEHTGCIYETLKPLMNISTFNHKKKRRRIFQLLCAGDVDLWPDLE